MKLSLVLLVIAACFLGSAQILQAQEVPETRNFVVPQSRIYVSSRISSASQPVSLKKIVANVAIIEQVSTTTLDFELHNPNNRWVESELLIPVPGGAILKGFSFEGQAKEPTVKILPKVEADKIYTSIVMKMKDPGLLEFVGYNLIKSSVFPIAANQTQKIRIVFENLLKADGDRIDYFIPRTESLQYKIPWEINVSIKSKRNLSTVYSPSHKLDIIRVSNTHVTVTLDKESQNNVGSFMLSYLLEKAGVSASLFAYPDPSIKGGYFLMLAGLPVDLKTVETKKIKREVILVLDRSGSMSGNKIEQVREAAIQVIGGLQDNESFNIITYNDVINLYSEKPVIKSKETQDSAFKFLKTITATSGTNIHDALLEALKQKPQEGFLPIVLFLTDGQPTVGNCNEADICKVATNNNPHNRRIFTFGVGYDVNAPLLEKVSNETRAVPTFVLPNEDVEVKVGAVFKRLKGPVMTDINLMITNGDDIQSNIKRVFDVYPAKMPDLYEGDQLVVLGKYLSERPLVFNIIGNYLGEKKNLRFSFNLDTATTRNSFVPRLWASKRIAILIDAVRALGAGSTSSEDPKLKAELKELTDEILKISIEFGIITEYTSFLADEGTDLSQPTRTHNKQAEKNLNDRAIKERSGKGGVNQGTNVQRQRNDNTLNRANEYVDENMKRVEISNVQQVNDRAFFKRGDKWIDSQIIKDKKDEKELKPDVIIRFGSKEYEFLLALLAKSNRQGTLSLKGDILIKIEGKIILITMSDPKDTDEEKKPQTRPKNDK